MMYDPKEIKSLQEKQNDFIRKQWKYKKLFYKFQERQHKIGTKIQALKKDQEFIYS